MASINKLSIRGVRSFSPDDKEQFVEFYFPFTIIVGANGCGKTTIIECLKYAVTGGFPPGGGAGAGRAFVHDPRSIGQSNVKANVKLRFTSRSGVSMVVSRSMELTQKKTTLSFKQLDGVLRSQDPTTGERVSLSHKCSELDKQVPTLLGVTRPILEHVVFCHQEDASWPLQEGAVLKKRFDEIFDSTRYTKALDVIKKQEKEFTNKCKDLKADLAGLASHRHAAQGFRRDLEDRVGQIEDLEEEKTEISQSMDEASRIMEESINIINQMDDVQMEIVEATSNLEHLQGLLAKQQSMLETDYTDTKTVEELREMLQDFDRDMSAQAEQKEELERRVQGLKREMERLRRDEMRLTSLKGKFAAEREAHEQRVKDRYTKMDHVAKTYAINLQTSQSQNISLTASMVQEDDDATTGVESLTAEDMQAFFDALQQKETDLKDKVKNHRQRTQTHEDELQNALTELGGKLRAVENERTSLIQRRTEAQREQNEISKDLANRPRVRKGEIEDARKQAERFAKQRDEANNNPRKHEIPIEVRQIEEKMDKIKRQLDEDRIALGSLRHSAEAMNAVIVLKDQCSSDLENLAEGMREQTYLFQKHNVDSIADQLPMEGDDNGDQLVGMVDSLHEGVLGKFNSAKSDLETAREDVAKAEQVKSEKSALLSTNQRSLASTKNKLEQLKGPSGSVVKVQRVVEQLRRHELDQGTRLTEDENSPKELLAYLEKRIETVDDEAPDEKGPKIARRVLRKLFKPKQVNNQLQCPCCRRGMTTEEVKEFVASKEYWLGESDLVKFDEALARECAEAKENYQRWRKVVSDRMDDLRDFARFTQEQVDLEKEGETLRNACDTAQAHARELQQRAETMQSTVDDLRGFMDWTKRWSEAAGRISEKKMQIHQKNLDLSVSTADTDGRDLRTVEREMNERMDEKDTLTTKINQLNKEHTTLNNNINNLSSQASRMEDRVREKETKYAAEQKANERKAELLDQLEKMGEEEKKIQEQIAPLKQKIKGKETEKQRMRALANEEEHGLNEAMNQFTGDKNHLHDLTRQITGYTESNKPRELERVSADVSKVVEKINGKKTELEDMRPELERVAAAVNDQERHKKQLTQNIEVLNAKKRMEELGTEIERLEKKKSSVEGFDTAQENYDSAKKKHEKKSAEKARLEGRRAEITEQMRSLKRKLKSEEYRNVDEEYRVTMIKYETTQIAAEDLKKYYIALDKALLKYHGVKIGEINKIIRELWLLTYKGEDIGNIEIVSGQEPGSRASKSYNYRVVMTKGSTQLDMRGRCSAGQRVLASLVIRLALAETFGVMCGCIALDEPTVNLDYRNKKGLAVALAQIIAHRAQQRNFQLILITHDEEFVGMMKTELSSLTGFSMPEKYFSVHREEASDGKFYSKIDEMDWDELV